MAIKARRCFVPRSPSDWVAKVFLTCDNKLVVQFKHGQHVKKILPHGPGAYLGHGGVPSVCCLYPGTQGELAETLYELARVWSFAGEWVHAFLYKKFGYQMVPPPAVCGGCHTTCQLTSSVNPANVGESVTFTATITNTDGSPNKGEAPEGTVAWYIDGALVGASSLPEDEPDSKNYQSVSMSWACGSSGDHTIQAVYQPASDDWADTQCSLTQTCQASGVQVACCPNVTLPQTLYLTISMASGSCPCLVGTYMLTWDANAAAWQSTPATICQADGTYFSVSCQGSSFVLNSGGYAPPFTNVGLTTVSCQPLQLTASNIPEAIGMDCNGSVNVTVTQ